MPYSAVYHTWNEDPYGGGWHEWKAEYRLDQIMWRMLQAGRRARTSTSCGEAYSYGQGWVEGALQTAEQMLEEPFRAEAAALARRGLRADALPRRRLRRGRRRRRRPTSAFRRPTRRT